MGFSIKYDESIQLKCYGWESGSYKFDLGLIKLLVK